MLIYGIILLAVAALFAGLGIMIRGGRVDLIHDYHQSKVTDPEGYGKAMGKAMLIMAGAMAISGGISLSGSAAALQIIAVAALLLGLGIGIGCMAAAQRKYNNGIF